MLNIFDIIDNKAFENFRDAFFDATGMLVSLADDEHKQYNTFYAGSRCEFCKIMNSSLKGLMCCVKTSREAGKKASKLGKALIYKCHAGLNEVVVPILVHDRHIGSVFSGQIMTHEPCENEFDQMTEYFSDLGLDVQEIKKAYMNIPVVTEWKLNLVCKMLTIIVDYAVQTAEYNILKEQITQKEKKLREIMPHIKNEFVNYIISNNTEQLEEINSKLILLGIRKVPNTVMYVKVNKLGREEPNRGKKTITTERDRIIELIEHEFIYTRDIVVYPLDNAIFMVVLYINDDFDITKKKEIAISIADRINKTIGDNTTFTATIGIGKSYRRIENLNTSYKEAFNACTYGLIIGKDQILHIEDIMAIENKRENYSIDFEGLRNSVISADENEVLTVYTNMFQQILVNYEFDLNKIKSYIIEFFNEVLNTSICGILGDDLLSKKIEFFQQLVKLTTADEIFKWGITTIRSIIHEISVNRTTRNQEIIEKAKKYIENNFSKELNLKDIAFHVHLSSNYFSWMFKKEIGMTYIEYLTKIRISKAKMLMETSHESIQNISELVGYKDPNYFSQVFKKAEGIRPSTYIKLISEKYRQ